MQSHYDAWRGTGEISVSRNSSNPPPYDHGSAEYAGTSFPTHWNSADVTCLLLHLNHSLCNLRAHSICMHSLINKALDTGYASNSTNTATPSRGNAVSATYAHQPLHLSAPGFAAPQAMPQAPHVAAPTSNAEYEALRNQAHEAYRGGDFHRALQLCQSVSCNPVVSCTDIMQQQKHACFHAYMRLGLSCIATIMHATRSTFC